ncbi:MAG: hypothetical protein WCJ71_11890, partial [Candidatus Omnitrophota bacterium]
MPSSIPPEIHPDNNDPDDDPDDEEQGDEDQVMEGAGNILMTLTGKELGDDVDVTNCFEKAKAFFRKNLQDKLSIHRNELGAEPVRFSNKSWKKIKFGLKNDILKAKLLPAVPSIIRDGLYRGRTELYKKRDDDIAAFHYFDAVVGIEDGTVMVRVSVGEDETGHLFYSYNHDPDILWEKRKGPVPEKLAPASKPFQESISTPHDESLAPRSGDVKKILESALDDAIHQETATSPHNDLPEPTLAQKEAGNYQKAHITIQGLEIAVENPAGSERSGVGRDGKKWTSRLHHHYGYIKGTKGRDKDHLDVFLGPDPETADKVFIVNQTNTDSGAFDEHKILIGFSSEEEARTAYLSNYEEGWQGLGSICPLFMDEFKDWLKNGDTTIVVERGTVGSYRQDPSWVGVDLDGTLARYDGWKGDDHIGEPVPLMMAFIKDLMAEGRTVKIFTARASDPEKIKPVELWLEENGLGGLEVTNVKDHNMTMLYDDRAAKVITNMGVILEKARESAIFERGPVPDFHIAVEKAV